MRSHNMAGTPAHTLWWAYNKNLTLVLEIIVIININSFEL